MCGVPRSWEVRPRSTKGRVDEPTGPDGDDTRTIGPREGSAVFVLEPGDYRFVPVGGDEDGPHHFTEDMVAELTVR